VDGEVDAGVGVEVGVAEVVVGGVAVHDRDERQVGCQVAECEVVVDGAALVGAQGGASAGEDVGFGHPVLWRCPVEAADLLGVAADRSDVVTGAGVPAAVEGEFGEPAGVQRPRSGRAREAAASGQAAV
jgi:hypothetical protein